MQLKQMNSYKKTNIKTKVLISAVVVVLGLSACAPRVATRGNELQMEDVAKITVGTHTKNNVYETLGSPSSMSNFGEDTWYYISQITETTAFLAPEIKERQIVEIRFDGKGMVTYVDVVDTEMAQEIVPAEGETPTAGNSLGFIDQMISNLGRFNK
ncbi:MAG: cell envelope protein SmpA [Rhodospirillaceae bacterium]|nr:MAG: cell envelope protein SmpA [Rhodospirillaceae bacterium]